MVHCDKERNPARTALRDLLARLRSEPATIVRFQEPYEEALELLRSFAMGCLPEAARTAIERASERVANLYSSRNVPSAELQQDLLLKALVSLLADLCPGRRH